MPPVVSFIISNTIINLHLLTREDEDTIVICVHDHFTDHVLQPCHRWVLAERSGLEPRFLKMAERLHSRMRSEGTIF